MIYRLKIGSFAESTVAAAIGDSSIERDALLVYEGVFQSADGEVKVTADQIEQMAKNHNMILSKVKRVAENGSFDIPLKHCPPIQLDHSTSAKDTVGRLIGDVWVATITNDDGKQIKSLHGKIRVLGKDNVEKVIDGRWTNLSIGADFDDGLISEVTVTPFPAASDASFLSKVKLMEKKIKSWSKNGFDCVLVRDDEKDGKQYFAVWASKKDGNGDFETRWHESENAAMADFEKRISKLSKGDEMNLTKLKKGLMKIFNLSEAEAEEKLKKLTDDKDDDKKLSDDDDADDKKKKLKEEKKDDELSDDGDEDDKKNLTDDKDADDKEKKLTSAREQIKNLSAGFKKSVSSARLAAKQSTILNRLSKLRAEGKVTPAEIKKMDISKLSAATDEAVDMVFKTYEDREPVIMVGMMGDARALDISKVKEKNRKAQLMAETRANMPFLNHVSQNMKHLKEGEQEGGKDTVNVHIDTDPHTDLSAVSDESEQIEKLMDEGKIDEAKKLMKSWMAKMKCLKDGSEYTETTTKETEKQLSAMIENVAKLEKDFDDLQKLASEFVG